MAAADSGEPFDQPQIRSLFLRNLLHPGTALNIRLALIDYVAIEAAELRER